MKASTKALTPSPLAVSGQIFFLYVKMFTYVLYVCFRSKKGLKWMILKENKNFGFKGKIFCEARPNWLTPLPNRTG